MSGADIVEWLLLLVIITVVVGFIAVSKENEAERQRAVKRQEFLAAMAKAKADLEENLADWVVKRQAEGWAYASRGKLMHKIGQPECIMFLSGTAPLLRVDEFQMDGELRFENPIYLNIKQIISISTARPRMTKSRKETVPVSIVASKNKSPVARGLIGGALLGPAGIVIGAASVLNSKIETKIERETVYREYEGYGAPQLIIGTNCDQQPILKIRCANQEVADEWMFRIRGRQSRG
jgi:hypothetical protein